MFPRRWAWLILFFGLIALSGAGPGHAQTVAEDASGNVRVGVNVSPPFVSKESAQHYSGLAIDLWEQVASNLGLQTQYVPYPTFKSLVEATASGEVQAAVTNLTITRGRAEAVSFTQPWYDAGLRIMVPEDNGGGFGGVLSELRDAGHLQAYAWLLLVIIIATCLVTLFDRSFDPEFPKRWREGMAESFYHVMSIAVSGKAARKNLFGWIGRIWQALWLLIGVAVIAYITSSVTSVMTAVSLTQSVNSLSDLPGKTVGVFTGSVAEDYVTDLGLSSISYASMEDTAAALADGAIDAIVGDAPILEHYAHAHPDDGLSVVGNIFHPDKYGFAFPKDSELTRAVTLQILEMQENGSLDEMRRSYFGNQH